MDVYEDCKIDLQKIDPEKFGNFAIPMANAWNCLMDDLRIENLKSPPPYQILIKSEVIIRAKKLFRQNGVSHPTEQHVLDLFWAAIEKDLQERERETIEKK